MASAEGWQGPQTGAPEKTCQPIFLALGGGELLTRPTESWWWPGSIPRAVDGAGLGVGKEPGRGDSCRFCSVP